MNPIKLKTYSAKLDGDQVTIDQKTTFKLPILLINYTIP